MEAAGRKPTDNTIRLKHNQKNFSRRKSERQERDKEEQTERKRE